MREFILGFCSMIALCGAVFAAIWFWLNHEEKKLVTGRL